MKAASSPGRPDLLGAIVAGTRRTVAVREEREPLAALAKRAEPRIGPRGRFRNAIGRAGAVNVIAECKRRSPSRGVLRRDYDAASIAIGYQEAGAAAISVLTEPTFFDGSLEDLARVRAAVDVPVLRKDFIVSEYQVLEACAAGADAILLIVGALERKELESLAARASALGLDSLVEVHDTEELEIAVDAGARVIGVNNRDLRTLDVNVHTSEELIGRMPPDATAVSESGLKTPDDIGRLGRLGYRAFLVGERLMSEPDPGRALRNLLEAAANLRDTSSAATETHARH
jgi:indole-3-glycerol phosphate synthase